MTEYMKYCYWVDLNGFKSIRKNLGEKRIQETDETHLPCRALKTSTELSYVTPSAWKGFCKRRTSWYWKSDKAEQFMVVSNKPMDIPGCKESIRLVESNFKPDRLPSQNEILELTESNEYQKRKPPGWDKPDPLDKDFYQRWFDRQQKKEPFDFDQILLSHSANHANFLDPKFFVTVNGIITPYSIADSLHVCSSCVEFFNILGEEWQIKYVTPCIGAVMFARLPIDRYFEVRVVSVKDCEGK